MNENRMLVRYFLYARKSTESEDRQVQSIEDQLVRLRDRANTNGLTIVDTVTEAKSAKTPEARPVFQDIVRRIRSGEADGILCWELSRLSRNPVDSGTLSWMLQSGVLKSIMTMEREFRPDDNVLLFSVESGMANQYLIDLSRNVKRGRQGKLERGGLPGQAPLGYVNDRLTASVLPDPDRFTLVRRAWDLLLTGAYSVAQLRERLSEWGVTTIQRKRSGGRPLSYIGTYKLLHNPFYAGIIRCAGREYKGAHTPMVTLREFEEAQRLLRRKCIAKPRRAPFTFSRLIRCGECGFMVTAEIKTKRLRNGQQATYTYYHCSHRRKDMRCSQRRVVREEALVERLARQLDSLAIEPEVQAFCVDQLRRNLPNEVEDAGETAEANARSLERIDRQLERLTEMYYTELLGREEYERERTKLQGSRTRLETSLTQRVESGERLLEFDRASRSLVALGDRFRAATNEERRVILSSVGSNCVLLNGNPQIIARFWLERFHALRSVIDSQNERFELPIDGLDNAKTDPARSACLRWWAQGDDIRNFPTYPAGSESADDTLNALQRDIQGRLRALMKEQRKRKRAQGRADDPSRALLDEEEKG